MASFFPSTLQIPASLPANSSHTVVSILWRAERRCKKKKKKSGGRGGRGRRGIVEVGGWGAAASQCLSVGEAERQQRRRRKRRRRPQPARRFPTAPPVRQDFHTASLVIEGAHSRRCTPLSSLPLRAAQFSAFCSLSLGLKRENMGSEVAEAAVCSSACCPQLSAAQGGEKKGGKNTYCSSDSPLLLPPPTSKALLSTHFLKARCSSLIHHPAAFLISSRALSFFPPPTRTAGLTSRKRL